MAISSKTLFHFTNKIDYLKGIIKSGFFPRYCLEDIYATDKDTQTISNLRKAIPMVCFCDIPLSQVKDHIEFYGNYGIGLKKSWGSKVGLNPLLYLDKESLLSNHIIQLSKEIFKEEYKNKDEYINLKKAYHEIIRYTKPYSGLNIDKSNNFIENYTFYNEREWRYVPLIKKDDDIDMYILEDEYKDDEYKQNANKKLEKVKLSFKPEDVAYIIVQSEHEVGRIIDFIERDNHFSVTESKLLISKLQTKSQIMNDF